MTGAAHASAPPGGARPGSTRSSTARPGYDEPPAPRPNLRPQGRRPTDRPPSPAIVSPGQGQSAASCTGSTSRSCSSPTTNGSRSSRSSWPRSAHRRPCSTASSTPAWSPTRPTAGIDSYPGPPTSLRLLLSGLGQAVQALGCGLLPRCRGDRPRIRSPCSCSVASTGTHSSSWCAAGRGDDRRRALTGEQAPPGIDAQALWSGRALDDVLAPPPVVPGGARAALRQPGRHVPWAPNRPRTWGSTPRRSMNWPRTQ